MIFDTDKVIAAALEAKRQTGEDYLSLTLTFDINRSDGPKAEWGSYTPRTNHTKAHATPEAALAATVFASTDAAKLLAQAEHLENEARILRSRCGGAK